VVRGGAMSLEGEMSDTEPDPEAVAQAHREALRHDINRLIEGLSLDDLKTLLAMFSFSITTGGNFLHFTMGQIGATLMLKHGYCVSCDKVHEDELQRLIEEGRTDT
jgi:RecA-family ATPase